MRERANLAVYPSRARKMAPIALKSLDRRTDLSPAARPQPARAIRLCSRTISVVANSGVSRLTSGMATKTAIITP